MLNRLNEIFFQLPFSFISYAEIDAEVVKECRSIRVAIRCQIDCLLTVLDCLSEIF